MINNFTNPWDVGGEEYEQNALHDNVLSGAGDETINSPTIDKGGFFNNFNLFSNWMKSQAKNNKIEVSAYFLKKKYGNPQYFVNPWINNKEDRSENTIPEGYIQEDIITQYHTHPIDTYPWPSAGVGQDTFYVDTFKTKLFVYAHGFYNSDKISIWRLNPENNNTTPLPKSQLPDFVVAVNQPAKNVVKEYNFKKQIGN